MSALWFIGFSLIWTALLAGVAHVLTRDPVPARFAHSLWRGAAGLSVLPWIIAGIYALMPPANTSPIPDFPYLADAVEVLSNSAAIKAAISTASSSMAGFAAFAILIAGWVGRLVLNVLCQIRLQTIKRAGIPAPDLDAGPWARRLGLTITPKVSLIPEGSPFMAGIKQRTVYLPEAVADPANANIIFAHECTHMARGDLITRPFERFVADLFWFSPFAWMMRRQLDYWREAACDEQTVALTGDSVAYARALATTARLTRPAPRLDLPVAAFILPRRETLKKRLTQLLEQDDQKPRRRLALVALVAGLVLAPMSLAQGVSLAEKNLFSHAIIMDANATVSAAYGKHVYTDKEWWHSGVDIKAAKYTLVYAPAKAKVLMAKHKGEYGNTVDILLDDGRKMRFSQLAHFQIKRGDILHPGQVIGKVGESGSASGPHLHLEFFTDGEHQDPENVKGLTIIEG